MHCPTPYLSPALLVDTAIDTTFTTGETPREIQHLENSALWLRFKTDKISTVKQNVMAQTITLVILITVFKIKMKSKYLRKHINTAFT